MKSFTPDLLPPDRREAAAAAHRIIRREAIAQRARVEVMAAVAGLQESLRTAGVVLAVLLVVGVYSAPVWFITLLFMAPTIWNGAVLGLAWWLARPRKPPVT